MKRVAGNKSVILGMAERGELKPDEVVYSEVNHQTYKVVRTSNHQGTWIGVEEIQGTAGMLK